MDYEVYLLVDKAQEELRMLEKELADAEQALGSARGDPARRADVRNLEVLVESVKERRRDLREQLSQVATLVRQIFDQGYLTGYLALL
jgi:uncharacterized coiled-coil DUF342 family protein